MKVMQKAEAYFTSDRHAKLLGVQQSCLLGGGGGGGGGPGGGGGGGRGGGGGGGLGWAG
jgi:hypothetical protein